MLTFAAATQGFFLIKNRIWETVALLLVAFTLLYPGFWWDKVYSPFQTKPPDTIEQTLDQMKTGSQLLLKVHGIDFDGNEYTKTIMLQVRSQGTGAEKLDALGIETRTEDSKVIVDMVNYDSPTKNAGIELDQEILNIRVPKPRPPKQLVFVPAIALLTLVWFLQRRRNQNIKI